MTLGCFLLLMFYVAKFEKVRYNYFIIYLECSDMDKNSKYTFFPHQFSSIRIEEMLDKFNTYDEFEKVFSHEMLSSANDIGNCVFRMLEKYNKLEFISDILPYVAVGTVADVVPLIGENRYFVTKGLELISNRKHYGLSRLLESAGYKGQITSEQIAFGIAPRINASGRLDTVDAALKVLISDNRQEIEMAIQSLNEFNKIRQELCQNTFAEADEMVKAEGNRNSAIVLFNKDWHIGIIGIVASSLVEKYYKPTFLMTYSDETKQFRCSARSIDGINLYDAISANAELFDGFGGHAMAAGLAFSEEKSSFEQVKSALCKTVKEMSQGKDLKPFINVG